MWSSGRICICMDACVSLCRAGDGCWYTAINGWPSFSRHYATGRKVTFVWQPKTENHRAVLQVVCRKSSSEVVISDDTETVRRCVVYLLTYLVDKSSSPDGTTCINLLRKESTVSASIILEDNKFQESTTRWEKNCFCISVLADGLNILSLWPRIVLYGKEHKLCGSVLYLLLTNLYVSIKSNRCLLLDRGSNDIFLVHNFSHFLWTESSADISFRSREYWQGLCLAAALSKFNTLLTHILTSYLLGAFNTFVVL